jgi:hypothetical protein
VEGIAVMLLIGASLGLTAFGERALRYTEATAAYLQAPRPYIDAVLSARSLERVPAAAPEREAGR